MNQETRNIVKKTVKIAGVTCIAMGSAALIASGAALKAVTAGARYLKDAIEKIVNDAPQGNAAAEVPAAEAVAEEADFAAAEAQEG